MKQRALGAEGALISEVGLGCWQFGGDFGDIADDTAMDIMAAAVDQGVNFFDTADVYGAGRSESLIGRFLKQHEGQITVATKFGRGGDLYPDNYSQKALNEAVESALKRLGQEQLDLLQLHCIPEKVLADGEIFDWLRLLKQQGLVKGFGASVETVDEGLLCLQQEGLQSLQVIFNLFRQKPAQILLPRAKEQGVGIIVRLPLASGLLSGKFNPQTRFADTDHRNYNRDGQYFNVGETFAGLPFLKGVELAEQLKNYVPTGMTLAQMSQRWILDHDAVTTIIPGASSPMQARANSEISMMEKLPAELHQKLSEFYQQQVQAHIRGPY